MKSFRCIVITGASSGIGEALALDYEAPGIAFGLSGRDGGRLGKIAEACRARGATVRADTVDATDRAAMADWLTAFDDAQPVDLLVANAGVSLSQNDPTLEAFDAVRRTMAINFDGVLNTVEPLVGRRRQRASGDLAFRSTCGWASTSSRWRSSACSRACWGPPSPQDLSDGEYLGYPTAAEMAGFRRAGLRFCRARHAIRLIAAALDVARWKDHG